MARLARVLVVDVPHHVTQRGNARQVILENDADRLTYLEWLREYSRLYGSAAKERSAQEGPNPESISSLVAGTITGS
jgi:REP element-mobilizing transposase RayT